MKGEIESNQDFSSKEVARRLGIESVTVRKYCNELEHKGYEFKKNERGWRVF
ncbi:HTH domain-containing protein [Pontibacillus yanchengensis]|uniref:HTH domain-containing protein n=2 Tax=Pontibacillus yanchengensis TaxID=462910 RepID=A0ACC7VKB5_9BACI|nr:HTH domain-containing protein [Pontibacillus yanchengensis]MYL36139.1 HTH domain-containing protein [Pontibacillus yanchengensis]MYL55873.1 HTH domain-containing protein [Pontibacillus yanchengensis]